jgi:chromosome segregation ATPase
MSEFGGLNLAEALDEAYGTEERIAKLERHMAQAEANTCELHSQSLDERLTKLEERTEDLQINEDSRSRSLTDIFTRLDKLEERQNDTLELLKMFQKKLEGYKLDNAALEHKVDYILADLPDLPEDRNNIDLMLDDFDSNLLVTERNFGISQWREWLSEQRAKSK